MYSVDIYSRVRRACLKDGMSAREAARYFNKDRKTIAKMLRHELPPGYQRSEPARRPTLDGFVGLIDEILRKRLVWLPCLRPQMSDSVHDR